MKGLEEEVSLLEETFLKMNLHLIMTRKDGKRKETWCVSNAKKLGHIKYDCPLYKIEAKRRMKKTMMTTWSESEESSKEEKDKEVANMCFMVIDELDEGSKKDKWFLDSGCSRHMTGDESKFAFLTKKKMRICYLWRQRKRKDHWSRQHW